jgi:hypothetical protein
MNPPEVMRPQRPLLVRILGGMVRIHHIKQFITFAMSVCVILWIVRVLRFKTFGLTIFILGLSIAFLSLVEPLVGRRRNHSARIGLIDRDPIDVPAGHVPYTAGEFRGFAGKSPDATCAMCDIPFAADDAVAMSDCRHLFHEHCFKQWISVEATCPSCHSSLL